MKIASVSIKNYRALSDFNVTLNGHMNVLYGINGIGKSSFLYILHDTLLKFERETFYKPLCTKNRFIDKDKNVEINITYDDGSYLYLSLDKNLKQKKKSRGFQRLPRKSLIPGMVSEPRLTQTVDGGIVRTTQVKLPKFVYTRGISNFERLKNEIFNLEINENKTKLSEYEEKNRIEYEDPILKRIRQTLKMINRDFKNLTIVGNIENKRLVVEKTNSCKLNVEDQLSSGEASVVTMLASMCITAGSESSQNGALFLIDEIDASLHPEWQVKICTILKNAFPEIQFIISSHSPFVWAGLNREEIIWLERNSEGKVIRKEVEYGKGGSIEEIIAQYFNTPLMNEEVAREAREIEELINCKKFDIARNKLITLKKNYGNLPLIEQIEFKLRMLEL